MAGVQFRRQDNLQKPPRFRCSIVCEFILRQATLSCPVSGIHNSSRRGTSGRGRPCTPARASSRNWGIDR
jgi:hypothetical protein